MNQTSQWRPAGPPNDPLFAIIEPSLKVGAACGGAGFLFGGAAGIIKGTPPFFFASASALQSFALGTTFWGCRSIILQAWATEQQNSRTIVSASTISGGITGGAVAAVLRGRSNVIPGAVMFSLFGFLGQTACNKFLNRPDVDAKIGPGFWRRMSEMSFSPVKVMSNEEYVELLREKMLKVDVEIAILDDKITAVKNQQGEQDAKASAPSVPEK